MPRVLPYLAVQPDAAHAWADVRAGAAPSERVWASAYRAAPHRSSVHGGVHIADHGRTLAATDPALEVHARSASCVAVACAPLGMPATDVHLPTRTGSLPGATGTRDGSWALALATSAASGMHRWCAGGPSGTLHVGEWAPAAPDPFAVPIPLAGHCADITSVRFFPSGEVVLTTSLDATARIYSALDGANPRTLTGHTRAVYASAMLGRGREVLTGSLDATVRLWDVGAAHTTATLDADDGVCALDAHGPQHAVGGTARGTLAVWDVRAGAAPAATATAPAAPDGGDARGITALAVGADRVAVGTRTGVCAVYDVRRLTEPVAAVWRNTAEVADVQWSGADAVCVATRDGLPFRWTCAPSVRATDEYVGWDADAVDALRADAHGTLVAAGAAGAWAMYAPL